MKLFPILFLLLGTVAFVSGIFVRQKKEADSQLFIALMVAGGICIVVSIVWSGFVDRSFTGAITRAAPEGVWCAFNRTARPRCSPRGLA